MDYSIYIWPSTETCFIEVAETLCFAILNQKGKDCKIQSFIDPARINVIFGINKLVDLSYVERNKLIAIQLEIQRLQQLRQIIIFNMEQLYDGSYWLKEPYASYLKDYPVWDYNSSNQRYLKNKYNKDVPLLQLGYCPTLERIILQPEDIDVLFYGGVYGRRFELMHNLLSRGINVLFRNNDCWGTERDKLIARSKIVLNVHFYEANLFEMVRVWYLLHNRKFVISEISTDQQEYSFLDDGLVVVPYNKIADAILEYLQKPEDRKRIADIGYNCIKDRPCLCPE